MIANHEMNSSELNSSFETKPFDEFNNKLNLSEVNSTYETGHIVLQHSFEAKLASKRFTKYGRALRAEH
jgi:hypothetical protein